MPDWSKADYDAMEKEIGEMNWEDVLLNKSGPEQWDIFKEKLNQVIDNNVPKKIRRNANKPLWMSKKVMRMIRKKRRMWKHYTSSKDTARGNMEFEAYSRITQ